MINLSLWFALHVLFREVDPVRVGIVTLWTPEPGSFNVIVAALTLLAAFLLLVRHWHVVSVLAVLGAAGLLSSTFI